MSHHKKKHGHPIPPANQVHKGPAQTAETPQNESGKGGGSPFQDQDAKRRMGDFESAGEHSRQQPGAINDGTQHSR